MCTGFVHKGKDRICGFNMDLPDGMLDWKDTYVYAILSREYIQYLETGMNPEERNHA